MERKNHGPKIKATKKQIDLALRWFGRELSSIEAGEKLGIKPGGVPTRCAALVRAGLDRGELRLDRAVIE